MMQYLTEDQKATIQSAIQILEGLIIDGEALTSPTDTAELLRLKLAPLEHEVFGVLFLTTRHQVIEYQEMFRGTIDGAAVYPREVAKAALKANAAAVIFAHNHPSGAAEPSESDRAITRRLVEGLSILDIRVLDHLVVSTQGYVSFAERGWL